MEQIFLERHIDQRGRVAPVPGRGIAQGYLEAVAVSLVGVVAGGAGHGPVAGKPPVEEKLLSQLDLLGRLGVLLRDGNVLELLQMAGESGKESKPINTINAQVRSNIVVCLRSNFDGMRFFPSP
jgi:hypothetical protein